jgi:hypothetical protein
MESGYQWWRYFGKLTLASPKVVIGCCTKVCLLHKMHSPSRSSYNLTKQQDDFIKITVVANASFTDWATNARHLDGTPLFDTSDHQFFKYCRSTRHLSLKRQYQNFCNGITNRWTPLTEREINPLDYLLPIAPIRALTDEEFHHQSNSDHDPSSSKMVRERQSSRSPGPRVKNNAKSDEVESTGDMSHVSHLFRSDAGCHTYFPGNMKTVLNMDDEQFEEMKSLAKPLKVGMNWGFRGAVLALSHGMSVPNTGGICSVLFLRINASINDAKKFTLAVLKNPDNDLLLLEAPASNHTESEEDLDNYLAELEIKTAR